MPYSLLVLRPNQDFLLNSQITTFACQGIKIQFEINPEQGLLLQINDGDKFPITQDMPMSIEGLRFTIKVNDDGFALFPQSDGMEISGRLSDPDVYRVLQSNLRPCLQTITKVSELEQDERQQGASKIEGNQSSASNQGYALLCQIYLLFHADGLDNREKAELTAAYNALIHLTRLAHQHEAMRLELLQASIDGSSADISLFADYDESKSYPYTAKLKRVVNGLSGRLVKEGELYLNYGVGGSRYTDKEPGPGHHEVIKIVFEGNAESGVGRYRCIIYNAGYESDWVDSSKGLVSGVKEYELTCANRADVERFIQVAFERILRGDEGISKPAFDKISAEFKKFIAREIRSNQKMAQVRGNCTTMSTRLFLEEMLSPALFKKLYSFVSNPASLNQLISSLPAPSKPSSSTQTTGKVAAKIQTLARRLSESKAFSESSKSNSIQELINKGDIDGISVILQTEQSRSSNMSYLKNPLDLKVNYNIGGGKQGTLLHLAIQTRSPKLAEVCLALGMTGFEKDAAGYPALHMAILNGQTDIAKMIVDKNKKRKATAALSTAANDGVTAIKLALECDRVGVINELIQAGVDLSPEKNDGHVILNMIIEKALFDADSANYFPILNSLIKNPAQNNIDPRIVNGLGKSSIEIFQGKIIEEAKYNKPLDPNLVELINNLCALDANEHAKILMTNQQLMMAVFPHLSLDVFKNIFKAFVDAYGASADKSAHYVGLIMPALQSDNTEKLEYMLNQKIPGIGREFLVYMFVALDIAGATGTTVSVNAIKAILKHVRMSEQSSNELKKELEKLYSPTEVADVMQLVRLKPEATSASMKDEVKDENPVDPVVEIPPSDHDKIKNELLQVKRQKDEYRNAISELFAERKKSYYKFGDLTLAIIKFITGFDVTRKESLLQPSTTIPEGIMTFWATITGQGKQAAPNKSSQNTSASSDATQRPNKK